MLHGTPPSGCPKCGETPEFSSFGVSAGFGPNDNYGLPERASPQWITENSEPDEFGTVRIPADRQDSLTTHATYWPDCDHIDDCECDKGGSIIWTLPEYSG